MCQAGGVIVEKRIIVIRRVTVPRQISNQGGDGDSGAVCCLNSASGRGLMTPGKVGGGSWQETCGHPAAELLQIYSDNCKLILSLAHEAQSKCNK